MIISPYDETHKADVALVSSSLPAELAYKDTTGDLAQLVGLGASRLARIFKDFEIKGNPEFHFSLPMGKTFNQRYKKKALQEVYKRSQHEPYKNILKENELSNFEKYLRTLEGDSIQ